MSFTIEATGLQISDAVNLALYKAKIRGTNNRSIIAVVPLGNGKTLVKLGDRSTVNVTEARRGDYPSVQSITADGNAVADPAAARAAPAPAPAPAPVAKK